MRVPPFSLKAIFLTYTALALFFTFAILGMRFFAIEREMVETQLQKETSALERQWTEMVDYTAYLMEYIGAQITDNSTDPSYIYGLLKSFRKVSATMVPWSTLTWTNARHRVTVTSNKGIMPHPKDLSSRDYIPKTIKKPGKLYLGQPVMGVTSGRWSIPGGMGVRDKKGRYVGAMITGLVIEGVIRKLEGVIQQPGTGFMLMEQKGRVIAVSQNVSLTKQEIDTVSAMITEKIQAGEAQGMLPKAEWTSAWSAPFVRYQLMHKYPYVMVTLYLPRMADSFLWDVGRAFLWQAALWVAAVVGILCLIHAVIVSPVMRLSGCVKAMVNAKEMVTIPEYKIHEIQMLAEGLRDVQQVKHQLAVAHQSLKELNNTLEVRVAEQTFALQKALGAKREFIRNMSHEMRISLQGLYSVACSLQDMWDSMSEDRRKAALELIVSGGERLVGLVNNLLDLSALETGKMQFTMEENNLFSVAESVYETLLPRAEEKGLMLVLEKPAENMPVNIFFDAVRMEQVMFQMVDNAIKFSPSGTIIGSFKRQQITYPDGTHREGVAFRLKDEGKGIPEAELGTIFHSFEQSSRTKTHAGGTGLGLTLCYEIVKAHKGDMWAENCKDGRGSLFIFVLPSDYTVT